MSLESHLASLGVFNPKAVVAAMISEGLVTRHAGGHLEIKLGNKVGRVYGKRMKKRKVRRKSISPSANVVVRDHVSPMGTTDGATRPAVE